MSIDLVNINKKIYDLLIAANICGGRVYDTVPPGTAYPLVEISGSVAANDDASTDEGEEHIVTINAWSEYAGQKELLEILASIRTALHLQVFTTAGSVNCIMWIDSMQTLESPDGVGHQGIIRARIIART